MSTEPGESASTGNPLRYGGQGFKIPVDRKWGSLRRIKNILYSSSDAAHKVQQMLDVLVGPEQEGEEIDDDDIEHHFDNIILIIWYIPPDHQWQSVLLEGLRLARNFKNPPWRKNFRFTSMEITEYYHRGLLCCEDYEEREKGLDLNPAERANFRKKVDSALVGWRNVSSFICRWIAINPPTLYYKHPIWQMRYTIEDVSWTDAHASEQARDARIWVVTEWFIHCADILYKLMNTETQPPTERVALTIHVGGVCPRMDPLSVERWAYWKSRLQWKLDIERIDKPKHVQLLRDALSAMDEAERNYPATQLPFPNGLPDDIQDPEHRAGIREAIVSDTEEPLRAERVDASDAKAALYYQQYDAARTKASRNRRKQVARVSGRRCICS